MVVGTGRIGYGINEEVADNVCTKYLGKECTDYII